MTGFEPRTSGIGSDRSTNWATTTAQAKTTASSCLLPVFFRQKTCLCHVDLTWGSIILSWKYSLCYGIWPLFLILWKVPEQLRIIGPSVLVKRIVMQISPNLKVFLMYLIKQQHIDTCQFKIVVVSFLCQVTFWVRWCTNCAYLKSRYLSSKMWLIWALRNVSPVTAAPTSNKSH